LDCCPICFGDIDNDGDYDLIRGHDISIDAYLTFYRNIGTPERANFILEEDHFLDIEVINTSEPYLEDIDNDGDLDLFVGDFCGGVSFWRNNEITGVAGQFNPASGTKFKIEPCFPNPFNLSTTINFTLDKALPVQLKVYNQLGQEVWEIGNRNWELGANKVVWNAAGFSSGIYLISLESPNNLKQTKKVILLK
jgi:hypothetical protein